MSWLHNLKTSVIFSIVLFLLIFLSCDIFDSKILKKLQIEGNVVGCVDYAQFPDSSITYHKIKIYMETEKTYPCANYSITTKVSKHYNNITIALLHITVPEICITALGPAGGEVVLNLADGDYSLKFFHNGATDYYKLSVHYPGLGVGYYANNSFTKLNLSCR